METNGQILKHTIDKIAGPDKIPDPEKLKSDAIDIMNECGKLLKSNAEKKEGKIGLVYGKVQSGKTNAMIASTALAFDNGFKIAIILTSSNKDLETQTKERFQKKVFAPDYYIRTVTYGEIRNDRSFPITLKDPIVKLIVVAQKNAAALEAVIDFLDSLDPGYQAIIFDDEGDNYSLDNNRRDRDEDEDIPPTAINDRIFNRLRNKIPHVLVSVTGTPQGVILEGTNESLGFKYLLEPVDAYVGGESFFGEDSIADNDLISPIDSDEVKTVVETRSIENTELRNALLDFYVLSTIYNAETGEYAEFLCHPGQTKEMHKAFREAITDFHNDLLGSISNENSAIMREFERVFEIRKVKGSRIQYFDQFKKFLKPNVLKTRIVSVNSDQNDGMAEGHHHVLVGGNILGRGVTIEHMLVMYYGRNPKTTNMDTLYQHARMFGYRKPLLKYMRIYMPEEIYAKFHATYLMDELLRGLVGKNPYTSFSIPFYNLDTGLRITRPNVESKSFLQDVFIPRRQFYPNHVSDVFHKKNSEKYDSLGAIIARNNGSLVDMDVIENILKAIETSSSNQWKDGRPIAILRGLLEDESDKRIRISTNIAETRSWKKGAIGTGTLDGTRVENMRKDDHVGICFSSFAYKDRPELGKFWYPTIVFPERMDGLGKVYVTK